MSGVWCIHHLRLTRAAELATLLQKSSDRSFIRNGAEPRSKEYWNGLVRREPLQILGKALVTLAIAYFAKRSFFIALQQWTWILSNNVSFYVYISVYSLKGKYQGAQMDFYWEIPRTLLAITKALLYTAMAESHSKSRLVSFTCFTISISVYSPRIRTVLSPNLWI